MTKPRLLDLFCGAGGAAMGYYNAGFQVIGVDIEKQPHYPFTLICADAIEYVKEHGHEYDAVHASPPCQSFSAYRRRGDGVGDNYVNLIPSTRAALTNLGIPWIIENIPKSPLINPVWLCGSSFKLNVRRHRGFESNSDVIITPLPCNHAWQTPRFPCATNRVNLRRTVEIGVYRIPLAVQHKAMGITWMTLSELSQAIPPAYTEYVGGFLMKTIRGEGR